jgi:hypothetical protein
LIATKRNRSSGKLGYKRGVPVRMLRAIAKKYRLDQLVVWTVDRDRKEKRARIVAYGRTDAIALQATTFAGHVAGAAGWPKKDCEFEIASIRRLKARVRELETALAQIVEGCPDPVGLARSAGKFPDESDGEENLGEWIFYPKGKLSRASRFFVGKIQALYLARLVETGFYGTTVQEAAERLIDDGITSRIREGTLRE